MATTSSVAGKEYVAELPQANSLNGVIQQSWRSICQRRRTASLRGFSADRKTEHPSRQLERWTGILRADACGVHNDLCQANHKPAPALCWSQVRTYNAAKPTLRGIPLGHKVLPFGGSPRGLHAIPDRHRQDERRRSSGLAARPCNRTRSRSSITRWPMCAKPLVGFLPGHRDGVRRRRNPSLRRRRGRSPGLHRMDKIIQHQWLTLACLGSERP